LDSCHITTSNYSAIANSLQKAPSLLILLCLHWLLLGNGSQLRRFLCFRLKPSLFSVTGYYLASGRLLTTLHSLQLRFGPRYITSGRTPQKTPRMRISCQGDVFTDPLPSNGRMFTLLESSNGCLFHNSGYKPSCCNIINYRIITFRYTTGSNNINLPLEEII
jgi:hypothetical protein